MDIKQGDKMAWYSNEHEIMIRDDIPFRAFSSDGETGIVLETDDDDLEFKSEEAAFLFGEDQNDLWFRSCFGSCFKISVNPGEEVVVAKLYNLSNGVFRNCSLQNDVRVTIPVYHNALTMIPTDKIQGNCTETYYEEIKSAIDDEVKRFDGSVVVRHRPEHSRLYDFDLIEIKTWLFLIVYAGFDGEWYSEEEDLNGEPPLWTSEMDCRLSPVFEAMKCRDMYKRAMPDININTIVILPNDLVVVNENDQQDIWRETCMTTVLRTVETAETKLPTLRTYFSSLSLTATATLRYNYIDMMEIADRFSTDSADWMFPAN